MLHASPPPPCTTQQSLSSTRAGSNLTCPAPPHLWRMGKGRTKYLITVLIVHQTINRTIIIPAQPDTPAPLYTQFPRSLVPIAYHTTILTYCKPTHHVTTVKPAITAALQQQSPHRLVFIVWYYPADNTYCIRTHLVTTATPVTTAKLCRQTPRQVVLLFHYYSTVAVYPIRSGPIASATPVTTAIFYQ